MLRIRLSQHHRMFHSVSSSNDFDYVSMHVIEQSHHAICNISQGYRDDPRSSWSSWTPPNARHDTISWPMWWAIPKRSTEPTWTIRQEKSSCLVLVCTYDHEKNQHVQTSTFTDPQVHPFSIDHTALRASFLFYDQYELGLGDFGFHR